MTNVLFIHYGDFDTNSGAHIFNLANRLVEHGLNCAVAVRTDKSTVRTLGDAKFVPCEYADLEEANLFPDGRGPDLLHAWTPREVVRRQAEAVIHRFGCAYIVHLEDNEEFLFSAFTTIPPARVRSMGLEELDKTTHNGLSHPIRYKRFLAGASGVTVIINTLREFIPPGVPSEEIPPGYDEELFLPREGDRTLRRSLGIQESEYVVVYPGNAHSANAQEIRSMYSAVGIVNRQGYRLRLVRCGRDSVDLLPEQLHYVKDYILDLGPLPHLDIPRYLALADFFVQPGPPNCFNDYRIPSKLPEFFAMGRPVILPKSNIGRVTRHEVDALVMEHGHNLDITRQLCRLIKEPGLRKRLGTFARGFAEKHLNWNDSVKRLLAFYERILGHNLQKKQTWPGRVSPENGIESARLLQSYAGFAVPSLSYATVADYVDSAERVSDLAGISNDIKDVQRPWAFKALVGCVPPGSRLLEIGAGDPWVAQKLVDHGFEVVVVDPYEGDARGPSDFETIRKSHNQIRFIRGRFPQAVPAEFARSFAAIYSISVLEHIPLDEIDFVFAGIKHLLSGADSRTIHAIDHVYRGRGDEYHMSMLKRVVGAAGLPSSALDRVLLGIEKDPDAYFLSAEAHNRWRGSVPYSEFPMRRVVSIQLCTRATSIKCYGTHEPLRPQCA